MTKITLKTITSDNWRECIKLNVGDNQKQFVASNMYSLAESAFEPDDKLIPLGIYDGENMVGFLMYGCPTYENSTWEICRLMIDKNHQKKGYGRAAMEAAIERISNEPDCDAIYTSYEPNNEVAAKLYADLGFLDTGQMLEGEVLVRLPVEKD
jgi:diamine N-acetyltransferase